MKLRIISRVRIESAAGWYLGSIEIENGEVQPYNRDSMYYPTEDYLKHDYPRSISLKEAFERGRMTV